MGESHFEGPNGQERTEGTRKDPLVWVYGTLAAAAILAAATTNRDGDQHRVRHVSAGGGTPVAGRVEREPVHHLVFNPGVLRLQKLLAVVDGFEGTPDGFLGPKTRAAIKRFQRFNNLPETGEFDGPTTQALESQYHDMLPHG